LEEPIIQDELAFIIVGLVVADASRCPIPSGLKVCKLFKWRGY